VLEESQDTPRADDPVDLVERPGGSGIVQSAKAMITVSKASSTNGRSCASPR